MKSSRKNRALYIDKEALATLAMAQEGILYPVTKLMNEKEAQEVDKTKIYKNKTFPYSFVLAPAGKRNEEVLKSAKKGEVLDLVADGVKRGEIKTDNVFKIDPKKRVKNIYATEDLTHPGVISTLKRLGNYAICGDFWVDFEDVKKTKRQF